MQLLRATAFEIRTMHGASPAVSDSLHVDAALHDPRAAKSPQIALFSRKTVDVLFSGFCGSPSVSRSNQNQKARDSATEPTSLSSISLPGIHLAFI